MPKTFITIKYDNIAIIIDEEYTPLLNAPSNTFCDTFSLAFIKKVPIIDANIPTEATIKLNDKIKALELEEVKRGGVYNADTSIISTITSHDAGYINQDLEKIVGFQTDKPFKRALHTYGGIRMAEKACKDNGYEVDPEISEFFTLHRKTHNAGVFDAYTPEMRACRSSHIITGLPDAYGRGRIIGDYRRVALYGIDFLIEEKQKDIEELTYGLSWDGSNLEGIEEALRDFSRVIFMNKDKINELVREVNKLKHNVSDSK